MGELEQILEAKQQEDRYKKQLSNVFPFIPYTCLEKKWNEEWNNTYSIITSMERNNEYGVKYFVEHYKYKTELVYETLLKELEVNPQQLSFEWDDNNGL